MRGLWGNRIKNYLNEDDPIDSAILYLNKKRILSVGFAKVGFEDYINKYS